MEKISDRGCEQNFYFKDPLPQSRGVVWRKQYELGAFASVNAGEEVVPASGFRAAQQKIRNLERLLGKKTMENEILDGAVWIGQQKLIS